MATTYTIDFEDFETLNGSSYNRAMELFDRFSLFGVFTEKIDFIEDFPVGFTAHLQRPWDFVGNTGTAHLFTIVSQFNKIGLYVYAKAQYKKSVEIEVFDSWFLLGLRDAFDLNALEELGLRKDYERKLGVEKNLLTNAFFGFVMNEQYRLLSSFENRRGTVYMLGSGLDV